MICLWRNCVITIQNSCFTVGQAPLETRSCSGGNNFAGFIYSLLGIADGWSEGSLPEGGPVESNERYYRRRAVEERMAAKRAMTEPARVWHAKLAQDFAERASACSQSAVAT